LRAQRWLADYEINLATMPIIPFDAAAAGEFDKLRQNKKLRKIGRADILIASIALGHKSKLITRNLRDFRQVPGLEVENWAE
jgi:tRNA(fMet)-specific endonuclease VapC